MSASIAMRLVGYTRVAIICQRPSGMLARSYDRSSEQSAQNCTSATKTAVVLGRRNECSPRARLTIFLRAAFWYRGVRAAPFFLWPPSG